MSAQGEIETELVVLQAKAVRFANECGRPRYRRKDTFDQFGRLTGRAAIGLQICLDGRTDFHSALAVDHRVFDWSTFDGHDLADQLHEIRERAAVLATVHAHQRIELRIGGALVDEYRNAPAAL